MRAKKTDTSIKWKLNFRKHIPILLHTLYLANWTSHTRNSSWKHISAYIWHITYSLSNFYWWLTCNHMNYFESRNENWESFERVSYFSIHTFWPKLKFSSILHILISSIIIIWNRWMQNNINANADLLHFLEYWLYEQWGKKFEFNICDWNYDGEVSTRISLQKEYY